jgi:PmbA protein
MSWEKLPTLFDMLADQARAASAEVERVAEFKRESLFSSHQGQLDRCEQSEVARCGIRAIVDGREGYSWTEAWDEDGLRQACECAMNQARSIAREQRQDGSWRDCEAVELWSPMASGEVIGNKRSGEEMDSKALSVQDMAARAVELETSVLAVDARVRKVPHNRYRELRRSWGVWNSKGVVREFHDHAVQMYAYALAEQAGQARMAGESVFWRQTPEREDRYAQEAPRLARIVAERAVAKLGATTPATGVYRVLIRGEAMAGLLSRAASYFSAQAVHERTSIFSGSLACQIACDEVSIYDEPLDLDAPGYRPFDAEGASSQCTRVVRAGRLEGFLTNSTYARRLGVPHTRHASRDPEGVLEIAPSNLVWRAGQQADEQLYQGQVLVITDLAGFHSGFRQGSGAFSLQAEGELWSGGEKQKSLCNFVVSGSIQELLCRVIGAGQKLSPAVGVARAPDVLISDMSIAGAS